MVFIGVFSHPLGVKFGSGKSVFCIKQLIKIYGSWDIAKQYIVYSPNELLALINKHVKATLWDDAGVWAHRRGSRKIIDSIFEIKEKISRLYITASRPSILPRKLLNALDYFIYIYRPLPLTWGFELKDKDPWRARAILFKGEDGLRAYRALSSGREAASIASIEFDLYFEHYKEYEEHRGKYVRLAFEEVGKEI